jgi:prepilin-type N-terminal cleavage/methylation domain-containing protein
MKIFYRKNKGFTLIELLVVIAIIGILATTVIVNVNSARAKARDSVIMSGLDSYRAQAEVQYNTNLFNYISPSSVCSTSSVPDFNRIYLSVANQGAIVYCNATTNSYAVSATLNAGGYYCVDSTGVGKRTANSLGASTTCP